MLIPKKSSYFLYSLLAAFFGAFLLFPVGFLFFRALIGKEGFSLGVFELLFSNFLFLDSFRNSFLLALLVTAATFLISFPIAWILGRYRLASKKIWLALLWLPLIVPPFVGAIGLRQLFSRFGAVNLSLMKWGWITEPIDWLGGGGFWALAVLQVLHLYPIMVSQLESSIENLDPTLVEAARNCGARGLFLVRTLLIPLMMPGIFSGCSLVFLWSFTDLGTPLMLDYPTVVSVQIFNLVSEASVNPLGFGMVCVTALFCLALYGMARGSWRGRGSYEMGRRLSEEGRPALRLGWRIVFYAAVSALLLFSLVPHLGVLLVAFSKNWYMTVGPEAWTFEYFEKIFRHPLTLSSIQNSIFYSLGSSVLDLGLGLAAAFILVRGRVRGAALLDLVVMLPLVLPGLVLAFSYLVAFSGGPLDPRKNPILLLVVAYAVRRLPYVVRSIASGLAQVSTTLEEAARNCGAATFKVIRTITLPLMLPHLIAGLILAFSLAMLEVSDSLILAFQENFYPITKGIYQLMGRLLDGPNLACALGVLGMLILSLSLLFASESLRKTFS